VRGVDGASWNNNRLDFIAFAFQVRTHLFEFHVDDSSNVLTNDPSGPGFRNNSKHLRPEITVIRLALSLPGTTERLAWETPGKQGCSSKSGAVEGADVRDEDRQFLITVSTFS
jgi:hypothetical protein